MSVQSQIDRLAGAKTTIGNYLQQNGVAVPSGATLDEMALQLADVIEKQNKITAAGILKGDGAGGVSAAKAGTDYATPAQVAAKQDVILASGASVGDLIKVKAVDASGKPTAWTAAVAGTDYLKTAPVTSVNGKTGAVTLGKSDVGLGSVDNVRQYSASNPPPYPVTSVNGHTGSITVHEVPSVTTADNGKFLRVVNGTWAAVEIANANGGSF